MNNFRRLLPLASFTSRSERRAAGSGIALLILSFPLVGVNSKDVLGMGWGGCGGGTNSLSSLDGIC